MKYTDFFNDNDINEFRELVETFVISLKNSNQRDAILSLLPLLQSLPKEKRNKYKSDFIKMINKLYKNHNIDAVLKESSNFKYEMLQEKKLRIFDFDDTLVKTKSKIYVEKDGNKFSLTPAEFAVYEPEGNEKFDYTDFGKLIEPEQIKKYNDIFKKVVNSSNKKVTILTARGSQRPINDYLKMIGMAGKANIVALNNRDPEAKKRYVKTMMDSGYDDVLFIDDSEKNVKAVLSLKREFPKAKIKGHVAKL